MARKVFIVVVFVGFVIFSFVLFDALTVYVSRSQASGVGEIPRSTPRIAAPVSTTTPISVATETPTATLTPRATATATPTTMRYRYLAPFISR